MKNKTTFYPLAAILVILSITMLCSCKKQYNISVQQIDSLLNANQEVHIMLPRETNIDLVGPEGKQRGENHAPGSTETPLWKKMYSTEYVKAWAPPS
jgi:hypothetical protein